MDTIYIPLSDSSDDGRELQVSVEKDEIAFIIIEHKDAEGETIQIREALILSDREGVKLGAALAMAREAIRDGDV